MSVTVLSVEDLSVNVLSVEDLSVNVLSVNVLSVEDLSLKICGCIVYFYIFQNACFPKYERFPTQGDGVVRGR